MLYRSIAKRFKNEKENLKRITLSIILSRELRELRKLRDSNAKK